MADLAAHNKNKTKTLMPHDTFAWGIFLKGLAALIIFYIVLFAYAFISKDIDQNETLKSTNQTIKVEGLENLGLNTDEKENNSSYGPKNIERLRTPSVKNNKSENKSDPKKTTIDKLNYKEDFKDKSDSKKISVSLIPAPLEDLIESTKYGSLPKVSVDSLTPFDTYKKPFDSSKIASNTTFSIALSDFGLSGKISKETLGELPHNTTLLLSPYAQDLKNLEKQARQNGYETWLTVPIQDKTYPYSDPGTMALLNSLSNAANEQRLFEIMSKAQGYAGVYLRFDLSWVAQTDIAQSIISTLTTRGLGILDGGNSTGDVFEMQAAANSAPYIKTMSISNINLDTIEQRLSRNKGGVIILPTSPKILELLPEWIKTLQSRGYILVPLSYIAEQP